MYAYNNNGFSFRAVENTYTAQTGEVLFSDYATEAQLKAAFPGYAATQLEKLKAQNNAPILTQITALEQKQLRPLREYALGDTTALPRIQAIDSEIAVLRAQLK